MRNPLLAMLFMCLLYTSTAQATYIQVAENGGIVSYPTLNDFVNATSGSILNFVPAYGNDAGFFYDPVSDAYIQVAENGGIVSYPTLNDFVNATSGGILNFIPAYGNDAGFFYDPVSDAYIQVAENGGIVSYPTLNNFVNATSGSILNFIPAYGNDAGFFSDNFAPPNVNAVPIPNTLSLFIPGLAALGIWLRRRRELSVRA
jgi:phage pi2 protein 07